MRITAIKDARPIVVRQLKHIYDAERAKRRAARKAAEAAARGETVDANAAAAAPGVVEEIPYEKMTFTQKMKYNMKQRMAVRLGWGEVGGCGATTSSAVVFGGSV